MNNRFDRLPPLPLQSKEKPPVADSDGVLPDINDILPPKGIPVPGGSLSRLLARLKKAK